MSPYVDPPTIPEGMTVAQYRAQRAPRHLSLWKLLTHRKARPR